MTARRARAERYVSRALRDIRLIGKLANYPLNEEEIKHMFDALKGELGTVEAMFEPKPQQGQPEFRF